MSKNCKWNVKKVRTNLQKHHSVFSFKPSVSLALNHNKGMWKIDKNIRPGHLARAAEANIDDWCHAPYEYHESFAHQSYTYGGLVDVSQICLGSRHGRLRSWKLHELEHPASGSVRVKINFSSYNENLHLQIGGRCYPQKPEYQEIWEDVWDAMGMHSELSKYSLEIFADYNYLNPVLRSDTFSR